MMLNVAQLRYRYGDRKVLDGVDLHVGAGEIVALVGPNGAGKSTLLKCVNRVTRAGGGSIVFEGRDVATLGRRELARCIAYVPQQTASAMSLSVLDMIALGRAPHRRVDSGAHDRAVVLDVIERLGLQTLALRSYDQLSGGERQRVLLARALAQQARLLLLDEPTSDLDLRHQLDALRIAREVAREQGSGMLIAIHDLALASRFADRLVMLKDGRVFAQGPWQEVLTSQHIQAVYGVGALIGSEQGLPYVIPVQA